MKMKIRCGLLAVLLLGSSVIANAGNGIKRSEWSFKPEITTDNIALGLVGMAGMWGIEEIVCGEDSAPWWFPYVSYRGNPGLFLKENYTYHIRTKRIDRSFNNNMSYEEKSKFFSFKDMGYSFGGCVTFMSKEIPIGFWAKLSYERQVNKIKGASGVTGYMTEGEWVYNQDSEMKYTSTIGKIIGEGITLSKQMIVPEAGLKIRFGKYRTADQIFTIDLGARYDYAIDSKGIYNGKDVVNSGISGIFGFAYGRPDKHFQVGVNYEHPFYNYFNKDYSPDGGRTYPFRNTSNGWYRFSATVYVRRGF